MITKKYFKIAKSLTKRSLDEDGKTDPRKIKQILSAIGKQKPQGAASILKAYKRLMTRILATEEVILESPTKPEAIFAQELLKRTGARKIIQKTNPNLVLGAKIIHGDWVWDETLDAKLARLTQND